MTESFVTMLVVGGKSNSLGRASEVLQTVLADRSRLDELFECLFDEDAWVRMRAVDTLEKVCRVHPEWLESYVDRLVHEVAKIDQASIQWHLAEIFGEVRLTPAQRKMAIGIMKRNIADRETDWIVAANTMKTLVEFVKSGNLLAQELAPLLEVQRSHHSSAVVKRANKLLEEITG